MVTSTAFCSAPFLSCNGYISCLNVCDLEKGNGKLTTVRQCRYPSILSSRVRVEEHSAGVTVIVDGVWQRRHANDAAN